MLLCWLFCSALRVSSEAVAHRGMGGRGEIDVLVPSPEKEYVAGSFGFSPFLSLAYEIACDGLLEGMEKNYCS